MRKILEWSDSAGNRYTDENTVFRAAASGIESITILSSVKTIYGYSDSDYSFIQCSSTIKTVDFESNSELLEIQPYAFYYCTKLSNINLSKCNKLQTIGECAFCACSQLSSIYFPSTVQSLGQYAFAGCPFQSIQFPKSLKSFNHYAFQSCNNLETITFEENSVITSFDYPIFDNCQSLKVIHVPSSLQSYNGIITWNVGSVEEIIIDNENNQNDCFSVIDGVLFNKDKTMLIYYPSNYQKTFTFPEECTFIGQYSFACAQFDTIVLPERITSIGFAAFRSSILTHITLSDSITSFNGWVFSDCINLNSCNILFPISSLPDYTFYRCNFTSFHVPDGVETIRELCFCGNKNLKYVTLPSSLTDIKGGAFSECHDNIQLVFRNESNLYIDHQYLILGDQNTSITNYVSSEDDDEIIIPSTVTTIKSYSFSGKTNLKIIRFQQPKITTIESYAFYGCSNLEIIEFMPELEIIEKYAFTICTNLKNFSVSNTIQEIGFQAFYQCSQLTDFIMVEQTESPLVLGEECLSMCASLRNIVFNKGLQNISKSCFESIIAEKLVIPSTVSYIGENAFKGSSLTSITIENSSEMLVMGPSCFRECRSLNSFTFSDTVLEISRFAFEGTALTEVTLPTSVQILGEGCFKSCKNLVSFTIPAESQLEKCDYGIFEGASKLREIISDENNNFIVENGGLFDKNRTELVVFPPASPIQFFYFPSTVKTIRQKAVFECKNLLGVIIPDKSVETIEANAFQGSSKLERLNIPLSVKNVNLNAFLNCNKLRCGVFVSSTNQTFINNLYEFGKLPRTALSLCSQVYTCGNQHSTHFSYSLMFVCIILPSIF